MRRDNFKLITVSSFGESLLNRRILVEEAFSFPGENGASEAPRSALKIY
jgi:hypothetical protein